MILHLKKAIPIEILRFPRKTMIPINDNDHYITKARSFHGTIKEEKGKMVLFDIVGVLREWGDATFDETEPFALPCVIRFNMDEITAIEE